MLWIPNQNLEYISRIITMQKIRIIVRQPSAVVIFEKLPYIETYIYALGCLTKKTDDVYTYLLGCQMVVKSSTFGISKRSPRKIVSRSLFIMTLG